MKKATAFASVVLALTCILPLLSCEEGERAWTQVARLTGADTAAGDKLGISAAVSGGTVVVGAPAHDGAGGNAGAAYVFVEGPEEPRGWMQIQKLGAVDAAAHDRFGHSVAVSGATLVVGAPNDDPKGSDSGSASVFQRSSREDPAWVAVKTLVPRDGARSNLFGYRLDLDGDTVVVGAWRARGNNGAVYVFERNHGGPDNWGEVKKLVAADPQPNDQFGRFLAIDGDTAVVGAFQYGNYGPGKAYVLRVGN
jgi:hypothetical protein